MKVEEATDTIAKFFNDLIGAWVPGTVLAAGLLVMHLGPLELLSILRLGDSTSAVLTFAGILFALGHALLALYEQILKGSLSKIRVIKPFEEEKAKERQSYQWFSELVKTQQSGPGAKTWGYRDLRSVALSVSTEAASVGRRFTFIALLCNGVGTALLILAFDFAACSLWSPTLLFEYDHSAPWCLQVILLLGIAWMLFKQGDEFHNRAMVTPFSIAVAELSFNKDADVG